MAEKKSMNKNFQMLKGICALIVFFMHSLNIFPLSWVEALFPAPNTNQNDTTGPDTEHSNCSDVEKNM